MSGKVAVESALEGITGKMVGFECDRSNGYVCKPKLFDLDSVPTTRRRFPSSDQRRGQRRQEGIH